MILKLLDIFDRKGKYARKAQQDRFDIAAKKAETSASQARIACVKLEESFKEEQERCKTVSKLLNGGAGAASS
jgi:Zn-finger domain-containing protein